MNVIECRELSKFYGSVKAIKDISFNIEENKITGLIGRNGAGKTTLLKVIAGFYKKTAGEIRVFSQEPFNNLNVSSNTIYIDDNMTMPTTLSLLEILDSVRRFYPNWNEKLAMGLFEYFSMDPKQLHGNLSKGMKSTFNMIIGLSSRSALTIFDEPTTGMDAGVRHDFYRALLKDYIEYPRTILISSHLLNEIEAVLEDVLLVKEGEKHLHMPIADLKAYAVGFRGKAKVIYEFTKDREIIHRDNIGKDSAYIVVRNDYKDADIQNIKREGIDILSVASNDLCMYLTSRTKGGIDDVFSRS